MSEEKQGSSIDERITKIETAIDAIIEEIETIKGRLDVLEAA